MASTTIRPLAKPVRVDPVQEARIHLAAAHRMAVLHELEEGIDNHFTVTVPGRNDQFLVLPFGRHWSEARASDMFVFDEAGRTLEGEGVVELSARCIHAPIHRITGARVVMHTHQTWAVALNMLKDNRVLPASQTAAFFHGQIAYDDHYTGLADSLEEGERLAGAHRQHLRAAHALQLVEAPVCLRDGVAHHQHAMVLHEHQMLVAHQLRQALAFLQRVRRSRVAVVVGDVAVEEGGGLVGGQQAVVLQHV